MLNKRYAEPILNLTTRDRESGEQMTHAMYYKQHGNKYVVAACNDSTARKPAWYLNIKKKPIVEIEVDGMSFFARAETPVGNDRIAIWPLVTELSLEIERQQPRNVTGVLLTPLG